MEKGSDLEGTKSMILQNHLCMEKNHYVKHVVGRVLTIVDAISENETRRKAIHDLVTQAIWTQSSYFHDEIRRTCADVAELLGEKKSPQVVTGVGRSSIFNK